MAIRILDERLVNTIAAGEVVERPASVVKELVENALDAGATTLRVDLRAGGRALIRVGDDGSGMNATDALMCLERHATSKIRDANDLFAIRTMGFRGEAIPSIAAVSRFDLTTREHASDMGTRVRVEGGKVLDVAPAGAPPGTEVSVGSLFFNVPARRKFLRTVDTELGHCVEAVTRATMLRADVDVEINHDERTLLRAPRTADRARRVVDLIGPTGEALVPVAFSRGTLEVKALISPVGVHRQSAVGTSWLFVNGRFVRDLVLRRAVTAAYAGIVPKDRHPVVVLDLRIPPEDVDVNVHPAKIEVRFAHGHELQGALATGLREALQAHGIRRPSELEARYRPAEPTAGPAQVTLGLRPAVLPAAPPRPVYVAPPPAPLIVAGANAVSVPPLATPPLAAPPLAAPPAPSSLDAPAPPAHLLPVPRFRDLHVVGQLAATYILCEGAGELVVVDQHAAHERVTLYRLLRDPESALGPPQRRLVPDVITLGPARARVLAGRVDELSAFGLDLSPLGGASFGVQAVPAALARVDLPTLLADLADAYAEGEGPEAVRDRLHLTLATCACHGSIRAGQRLDHEDMRAILAALDEVDFSVCAHGRPVAIRVGANELERRFHRA